MLVTKSISNKIANMSLISAILVVSIHIGIGGPIFSVTWWLKSMISEGVARIAVPYFFVVSGFLIARHFNENGWWKKEVVKRIKTLVIPLIVWSTLFGIMSFMLRRIADKSAGRDFSQALNMPLILKWLCLDIMQTPGLFALWFVRSLFIIVCISPLILWCTRKFGLVFVLLSFIAQAFISCIGVGGCIGSILSQGISVRGICYFSFGIILFDHKFPKWMCNKMIARVSLIFGVAMIILWHIASGGDDSGGGLLPLAIPLVGWGVWNMIPDLEWPKWLTNMSFPIYLLHCFVMLAFAYMHRYTDWMPASVNFIARWIGMVIIPVAVALILRRLFSRISTILFGGR